MSGVDVSIKTFDVTEELVSDMIGNERRRTPLLPCG
jgi:hypothetical protein